MSELGEEYATIEYNRMGKINRFLFHWKQGRADHFPICCILHFSLESAFRDGKKLPIEKASGNIRGSCQTKQGETFIPCNVFHHREES